jgi:hypothetical protein
MKSSSSWMAVTFRFEVPRRRPLAVRYDRPSSPEGSFQDPESIRSWKVTNGRECSSQTMRTSRLGRTVLWTGGMAWREFAVNTSNKNIKVKRECFNFGMRNAECGIKNLKIKCINFCLSEYKILTGC